MSKEGGRCPLNRSTLRAFGPKEKYFEHHILCDASPLSSIRNGEKDSDMTVLNFDPDLALGPCTVNPFLYVGNPLPFMG